MAIRLEHPQTFLFMGRSGSGKGTQVRLLENLLEKVDPHRKSFHVYPGARFREFIRKEGYSSSISKNVYEAGGLQPEFLSVWMWSTDLIDRLQENEHIIFDGMPRKAHEAPILNGALKDFYKRESPFLIVLNVSRDRAITRLKERGREDDIDMEDIENRMNWYDTDVVPTIEYFRKDPFYRVIDLDGDQSIEAIHEELVAKLETLWQL